MDEAVPSRVKRVLMAQPGAQPGRRPRRLAVEAEEIVGRRLRQLRRRHALDLRQHGRGLHHVGRLVALAAVLARRQIGRIRLHQQPVERHRLRHLAQRLGFLERHDAGEGDVEPQLQPGARQRRAAGEAVQDRGKRAPRHLLAQDGGRIVVGVARVDDERQLRRPRRGDVAAEALRLGLARAVVVEVVEPRLADGHHLGVPRPLHDRLHRDIELLVGVVRVRADRAEHVVVGLGDPEEPFEAADARGDGDEHPHPRCLGAPDHPVEIVGEVGEIEVAVVIDEHGFRRLGQAKRRPNTLGQTPRRPNTHVGGIRYCVGSSLTLDPTYFAFFFGFGSGFLSASSFAST